jgi:hypothetical protein
MIVKEELQTDYRGSGVSSGGRNFGTKAFQDWDSGAA